LGVRFAVQHDRYTGPGEITGLRERLPGGLHPEGGLRTTVALKSGPLGGLESDKSISNLSGRLGKDPTGL